MFLLQILGSAPLATTAGPGSPRSSAGIPGYVWVIVAVVVIGAILVVVLALVIFLTRRNKKPKYI